MLAEGWTAKSGDRSSVRGAPGQVKKQPRAAPALVFDRVFATIAAGCGARGLRVADHEIDAKGLRCPEPLMIVRNKVRGIAAGEVVHVLATDPTTRRDFRDYCRFLGHTLIEDRDQDGIYEYRIRKGG